MNHFWNLYLNTTEFKKIKSSFIEIFLVSFICVLVLQGCANESLYNDGDYYGESEGYYSNIKVRVTINSGRISDITILEHNEPEILANIVFEKLPPIIIKKNSADVEIISGASYTSKSLIEAVSNALQTALKQP